MSPELAINLQESSEKFRQIVLGSFKNRARDEEDSWYCCWFAVVCELVSRRRLLRTTLGVLLMHCWSGTCTLPANCEPTDWCGLLFLMHTRHLRMVRLQRTKLMCRRMQQSPVITLSMHLIMTVLQWDSWWTDVSVKLRCKVWSLLFTLIVSTRLRGVPTVVQVWAVTLLCRYGLCDDCDGNTGLHCMCSVEEQTKELHATDRSVTAIITTVSLPHHVVLWRTCPTQPGVPVTPEKKTI